MGEDEFLWQGIVVQTVGTLLAATIIALVARLVGVGGYTPAVRHFVICGLIVLMLGVLYAILTALWIRLTRNWTKTLAELIGRRTLGRIDPEIGGTYSRTVMTSLRVLPLIAWLLATIFLIIIGLREPIRSDVARWTGYTPS